MLKTLRKKGVMKKILWVVAVIIILSFGFFGQAYLLNRGGRQNYAGKIFGKKISFDEYLKQYAHVQLFAKIQHGNQYNRIAEYLNMESQSWDRLILLHESNRRRIKITDQEVVDFIKQYPFFQNEAGFDRDLYRKILQYGFRTKERNFEEAIRDSLKISKLYEQETANVAITEEEILDAYKMINEKVQISYVFFANENYKEQVEYDEIQAKNYYLANKKEFLIPPMINVEYIKVELPEENDPDTPSTTSSEENAPPSVDQPLQETDTAHGEDADADPIDVAKDAALQKIQDVAKTLEDNPDFNQVAEMHGLTVETSGFFSMEQPLLKTGWTYPLLQTIFQLEVGQIVGPVETLKGYQMLKVIEKKEAYIPDYPEAEEKVKEAWMENAAQVFSKQDAEENLKTIQDRFAQVKRPDFPKIAKQIKSEIHQTPLFNRGQYLPQIGISRDFQEAAFSLTMDNRLSGVIETAKGFCILYLDEIVPIDMEKYTEEKDEFFQKILEEKQRIAFNDFLTLLRLKANLEDNISRRDAATSNENN